MKQRSMLIVGAVYFLSASVSVMVPAARAEDFGSALSGMEAALEKSPDDLRLGADYRQTIIRAAQYDRGIKFLENLVQEHDNSSNAHLNYAFAYVDKIPTAGSITQVLLANNALGQFTKSIDLKPSWIAYYSRGNSYMFWPKVFGRTPLGIADLEEAIKIQKADRKREYHVRTYIALGDGYWKMDELDKAKATWTEGLAQFPENAALKARLSKQGDDLKAVMDDTYDVTKRIDTSLRELFADQTGAGK
jgi:tetratricopeptide (TPR) repeat protein